MPDSEKKAKRAARNKAYRQKNKDKIAKQKREHSAANKDKIADYNKTYYEKNKAKKAAYDKTRRQANKAKDLDYDKKHYNTHKEKILERVKKYYNTNKEKRRAYSREYRIAHPKKIAEYQKEYDKKYRIDNQAIRNASHAKRRAAKLQQTPAWADVEAIKATYLDCAEINLAAKAAGCTAKFVVDHIVPLQGKNVSGLHVENNLQIITSTENSRKNNKFKPISIIKNMEK